jgi:hypothetical protein
MNRSYERHLMFVDVAAQWSRGKGTSRTMLDSRTMIGEPCSAGGIWKPLLLPSNACEI